jgi:peptidoglycan/xylan/chitin deacetylase (PgdA/CDA1 family)
VKGKIARRLARYLTRSDAALTPPQGLVTFTFDDAYSAACDVGAEIIERGGGRATYYVCGGLDQALTLDPKYHGSADLRRLQSAGHEIACHGFGHLNYQETTSDEIRRDLDLNAAYFEENGIKSPRNFAYPYGCVSPRVKEICAERFRSARGVQAASNCNRVDLSLLKSVPLYSTTSNEPGVIRIIEQARDRKEWLIFFGHDVTRDPKYFDMMPELLQCAVSAASRCNLPILTVDAALDQFHV